MNRIRERVKTKVVVNVYWAEPPGVRVNCCLMRGICWQSDRQVQGWLTVGNCLRQDISIPNPIYFHLLLYYHLVFCNVDSSSPAAMIGWRVACRPRLPPSSTAESLPQLVSCHHKDCSNSVSWTDSKPLYLLERRNVVLLLLLLSCSAFVYLVEMPFCPFKNALLYPLTKCPHSKCPFLKGHFE